MLLSVIVYNHKLTPGQWAGAGVVFAGISVEAWVKRRGKMTVAVGAIQVLIYRQTYTQRELSKRRRKQRSKVYNSIDHAYTSPRD